VAVAEILGAEVIYREDIEVPALLPSLIASVVGYAIFAAVEGFGPIFGSLVRFRFEHPAQLFYYALIGVVGAGMGILYSQSFYGAVRITKRLPGSRIIWPGVAGVLVGLMALALPGSLGTGYGWVQKAMGPALLTIPLWIVLLLPFAKILATSLSIGSGGSGGIFGPGMVIGGFMGAGIWRLLDSVGAPGIPHNPAPFVIVGMIACFGSIGRVPLAVMLMVGEMTGNLDLLIPAMIAVGIATFLIGDRTIYKSQLRNRAESPSQAFRFGLPMLDTIAVNEVVSAPVLVVRANQVAAEAAGQMRREHLASAPVVDEDGRFVGAVELKNVDRLGDSDDTARVGDFISRRSEAIPNTSSLADALEAIVEMQVSWVPVLDEQMQLVGVVGTSALLSGYQEVLRKDLTRAQPPARELVSLESRVNSTSSLVGTSIAEAGLPPGTIVVSVERNGHLSLPSDSFVFLPQDTINAFVPERSKEELRHLVETDVGGAQEEDGPDLV
jgi:CBS domain-containing protein